MAFESSLPAAYIEEDSAVSVLGTEHLVALDYAEPSALMLFTSRWWRRIKTLLKLGVVVGAVAAYPVATLVSHQIDDSSISLSSQDWSAPHVGVAITKIARELEGGGWAGDVANWHPQARLTAMPAWQEATVNALADHTRLLATLSTTNDEPDADLLAASRLLRTLPNEDMRARLTAAAKALNRYDGRVSRGLARVSDTRLALIAETEMFAKWAETSRNDLSEQINQETTGWPASKMDIRTFYASKARAHVAHEMLVAAMANEPNLEKYADVTAAMVRAEQSWLHASQQKPLIVSNQRGDGALLTNHLAGMAYHMAEARDASLAMVAALEAMPETGLHNFALVEQTSAPAP